jgi:precorrin-3B synthase
MSPPSTGSSPAARRRADRCPGVWRPWPADDGLLVRLRLVGGRVTARTLNDLVQVAERFGDGRVRTTSRANLQLRALPDNGDGALREDVADALVATGLVPSPAHELMRNVMVSPQSGLAGGRADLRPVAARLDALLRADLRLAELPGRFLLVLDDGRGDLLDRTCDLGLVALDAERAQPRAGAHWAAPLPLAEAPEELAGLAREFLAARGSGPTAAWHVRELGRPLVPAVAPDPALPLPAAPLPYGAVPGGFHTAVPDSGLGLPEITELASRSGELIVTPWRGVLVPGTPDTPETTA